MTSAALPTAVGAVDACIWLYLLVAHGGFWRFAHMTAPAVPESPRETGPIAVVMPARDEADVVGESVRSLLAQRGVASLHIVLVDDGSTDGTAETARAAALSAGRSEALTVVEGAPPPAGWTGKMWAVHQGVARALEHRPHLLLLTDADIRHAPASVSTLAAVLHAGGFDLASYMVRLRCATVAERLLIPAFVFFFFQLYPPSWIADPGRRTAGAAGGSILIRPEALASAGGIAAIRGEIIDDCALARVVKRSGGRVWLGLARETESLRAYDSFAEIGRMIARTAFNQLRHSTPLLALALLGLTLTYVAPVALLASGAPAGVALGAASWTLMAACYLPAVRFYRLSPLWALTLPAAAVFYMGATLYSAVRFWTGRGGQWKGRAQDRARQAKTSV